MNLRPGGILTICACVSEQLKKGVEPAQQPQQIKVPVKEQQTGQQPVEPQQMEQQKGRQPAEKEMLEEKVPEQQQQAQQTYAQRLTHEQQGQQGQQLGQQGAEQVQQPQPQQGQQQGEAQVQPQLQYLRQERVVAPAHRVIKVRLPGAHRRGGPARGAQDRDRALIADHSSTER